MDADNNAMRDITIDKIVVNIGVGQAGERLNKAVRVIEMLTHHKPVLTTSDRTVREFNLRKGLTIGAKVTLRKADAEKFLKEALYAREYKFPHYSVDKQGNAYFGIGEYTDFKGMKYDPEIGMFGMDVAVVLKRKGGARNKRRNIGKQKMSSKLAISKEETLTFLKEKFDVQVI